MAGLVGFCSLAITTLYLPLPILLIAGAGIAGRWPASGRFLMWAGALLLSIFVWPICIVMLLACGEQFTSFDLSSLIILCFDASLILLPLLDVMLIREGIKQR